MNPKTWMTPVKRVEILEEALRLFDSRPGLTCARIWLATRRLYLKDVGEPVPEGRIYIHDMTDGYLDTVDEDVLTDSYRAFVSHYGETPHWWNGFGPHVAERRTALAGFLDYLKEQL